MYNTGNVSICLAIVLRAFSPFNSSITRSDLNFSLNCLLCLDIVKNPIKNKPKGTARYCPDCNTKYKVATKETVKRLTKYVNGMPLARQEREFGRYSLNLSTKTMANWIIQCADRYLQIPVERYVSSNIIGMSILI